MYSISAKKVAGYVLLPGIVPRLRAFSTSGFGYLAFLIASLYVMVRILPVSHPYNNPQNMGKFGIRHVIAEAANHITFNRKNADQIFIFFVSIAAFLLLAAQIAVLLFGLFFQTATAGGIPYAGLFETPDPENDIAFLLLDQVFGVPQFFCNTSGTCTSIQGELPWPFHSALHTMFEFYSLAILLFAVIIFLYYVLVVVAETAMTGTPFGRRFNHIWAPLRLVIAVGALVPLNYGLNSGQYIALAAAKYGSSVATNGWLTYNRTVQASMGGNYNPIGERPNGESLAAYPNAPDIQPLVSFMTVVVTCRRAYEENANLQTGETIEIEPYLVKHENNAERQLVGAGTDFLDALAFYNNGDVVIRFGEHDDLEHLEEKGHVEPYCGELLFHTTEINQQEGSFEMQEAYWDMVLDLWDDDQINEIARGFTWAHDIRQEDTNGCDANINPGENPSCADPTDGTFKPPLSESRQELINWYQALTEFELEFAWEQMRASDIFEMSDDIIERGWGGAGIWYNKIAQMNGSWIAAVHMLPSPSKLPIVMEKVRDSAAAHDGEATGADVYRPRQSNETPFQPDGAQYHIAKTLYEVTKWFMDDDPNQASLEITDDPNIIFKTMNVLFGTYSLFNIRNEQNEFIHPLAQLVGIGKGLVDSAIRNLAFSVLFAVGEGAAGSLGYTGFGAVFQALSGMMLSITMIGMVAGFILYYILPFLPFMYFYFAVAGWVKSVFEAMVGVPLWALAHLRIDGNGFPGDQAANGYFLILEIFIRPILCVFGLLAGIAIFAAQARVLHDVFSLVIDNLTGFDDRSYNVEGQLATDRTDLGDEIDNLIGLNTFKRDVVDEFFFTILYTIVLWMMATASFKLIDAIPNSILRWIGSGVSSFGDNRDDPTDGLVRYAAIGGATIGSQVAGGLQQMGKTMGMVGGAGLKGLGLGKTGGGTVTSPNPPGQGARTVTDQSGRITATINNPRGD
ncbi:MAG: hypothetical protein EOM26_00730 [Alphaproteobacteria bacterium]|nr:hypothetical protein [Alphaproteobacteria bacterium]